MSVLDLYQNKKNKVFPFTAYYISDDKELSFSYHKIPRKEQSYNKTLHGVVIPEEDTVISTYSDIIFTVNDKIKLDGNQYAVSRCYKESEEEVINGPYRKRMNELKYLVLKG